MSPCIKIPMPDGSFAHATVPGPTLKIMIRGKLQHFEFPHYGGPAAMSKNGRHTPTKETHEFYRAIELWEKQSKRIDENGICIWDEPPKPEPINLADYVKVRIGRKTGWMKKDVYETEKAMQDAEDAKK